MGWASTGLNGAGHPGPYKAGGCMWQNGKIQALGSLTGVYGRSDAVAINDRGQVVGESSTGIPAGASAAITITANVSGPVILDLKGHTITGSGVTAVMIGPTPVNNIYPITVRNGTITDSKYGVDADSGASYAFSKYLSNITIDRVFFNGAGLYFGYVNSSTVSNCTFEFEGMTDYQSHGGNRYINDTFIDVGEAFSVAGSPLLAPPGPK